MDQLDAIRTFVAVADHGSFVEAAKIRRISPTAASRALADMEERLGTLLLRRTTRSVQLTPEGATFWNIAVRRWANLTMRPAACAAIMPIRAGI